MTRTVRFLPAAEHDLAESIAWYNERGKGLGAELLRAVEAGVSQIERYPHSYPLVHGDIRRAPLRRFPFCLFYIVSDTEILIIACFHVRRDPRTWKQRR